MTQPPDVDTVVGKDGAGYRFNDDLLISAQDQENARRLYAKIAYALDHGSLRDRFCAVDPLANRAKRQSRRSGIAAVTFVTTALLVASAEPLFAGRHGLTVAAAVVAGLLGLLGALIGAMGMLYARPKRNWLRNRLRTEQMRFFHYRVLLELSDLILTNRREEFLKRRAEMFEEFAEDVLDRPAVALEAVLEADWSGERLTPHLPTPPPHSDPEIEKQFFRAYERLRIQRQLDYAQYKLQTDGRLFSSFPRQQAFWLELGAGLCIAGTVIVHLMLMVGAALGDARLIGSWTHVLGVWFAIAALALKTLQEGLQPKLEVERYRHYRAAVRAAGERYEAATSLAERLSAATAVERASADEMVIFLRSGWESRFVM